MPNMYGGYGFNDTNGRVIGGNLSSVLLANNPWLRNSLGGGASGAGGMGAGVGGSFPSSLQQLLDRQQKENDEARAWNKQQYGEAKANLTGVMPRYRNDPMVQAGRGLASVLAGDPEAISDRVQNLITNKAQNALTAQSESATRRGAATLAAGGQADASSLALQRERIGAGKQAALSSMLSDLEVQRARSRNQDYINASNLSAARGNEMGAMDSQMAKSWIENLAPMYPADYSGMASLFARPAGGMGGGGAITGRKQSQMQAPSLFNMGSWSYEQGRPSPGQTGYIQPSYFSRGTGGGAQQQPSWWNQGGQDINYAGQDIYDMGIPTIYPGATNGTEQNWYSGLFA